MGSTPSTAYFECNEPGIYVFELVVSDGFTTSAPDTVKIEAARFTVKATPLTLPEPEENYVQYPTVSGAKLVYSAGSYNDSSWSIQCMDLETGRIDTLQSQPTDTMPKMDGDIIVWTTGPDGYYRAHLHQRRRRRRGYRHGAHSACGHKHRFLRLSGHLGQEGRLAPPSRRNTGNAEQYAQTPYDICGADITNPAQPVYFTIAEQVGHGLPYPYRDEPRGLRKPGRYLRQSRRLGGRWRHLRRRYLRPESHQGLPDLHRTGDPERSIDLRPYGRLDRPAQRCRRYLRRRYLRSEQHSRIRGLRRPGPADPAGCRWAHGRVRRGQHDRLYAFVLPLQGIRLRRIRTSPDGTMAEVPSWTVRH